MAWNLTLMLCEADGYCNGYQRIGQHYQTKGSKQDLS